MIVFLPKQLEIANRRDEEEHLSCCTGLFLKKEEATRVCVAVAEKDSRHACSM